MKTTNFKWMMPMVAFLFAVIFAFASQNQGEEQSNSQLQAAVNIGGQCHDVPLEDCWTGVGPDCKYSGMQVFLKDNETSCYIPLRRNIQ